MTFLTFIKTFFRQILICVGMICIFTFSGIYYIVQSWKTPTEDCFDYISKTQLHKKVLDNVNVFGAGDIQSTTIKRVANIYGSLHVDDSNLHDTNVYGALQAKNTSFHELSVNGSAHLENIQIMSGEFFGTVFAKQLTIQEDLSVTGVAILYDTTAQVVDFFGSDIYVNNTHIHTLKLKNSDQKPITLHLKNAQIDHMIVHDTKVKAMVYDEHTHLQTIEGECTLVHTTIDFDHTAHMKETE